MKRRFPAWVGLTALLAIGLTLSTRSESQVENFFAHAPMVCPLRAMTGWKCAFCGMTHAWVALFRGHYLSAVQENLFSVPIFAFVVITLLLYSAGYSWQWTKKAQKIGIFSSLTLLILYAVVRNLAFI